MATKEQIALDAYKSGCNCAQSVVTAFSEETGLSETELRKLAEGFGGGIGGMQDTCGAFIGACMMIGAIHSQGSKDGSTKANTAEHVREAAQEFLKHYPSLKCLDILDGKKPQHLKCTPVVEECVKIVESYIK